MYNQLPMQVALMEFDQELKAMAKEAALRRAARAGAPTPVNPLRRLAASFAQLARMARGRNPQPASAPEVCSRTELGSAAAA